MVARGLTLKGLVWVFTHKDCDLYHPLTMLSLMGDYQLHGLQAGGYHFTNVLLHAASVILLFLILRQMTGALWRSAFVAAVFAIHPLRVESVAWVAERKDVLGGFFFMLTLSAYVRYVRKPDSVARYLMVAAAFVLALLSKPTVVTLPLMLLLLDYWPLQRFEQQGLVQQPEYFGIPRRLILEKIPLLALAAGGCVMTVQAAGKWIAGHAHVSMLSHISNAVVSYVVYLRQMIWPEGLAHFYPLPRKGYPVWAVALSFLLLALVTGGVLAFRRKRRWLLAGWFWYLGMLTPMIGLVQVAGFAHADRYTYLPQIGIYLAVTWLVAEWQMNRWLIGGLMTAVLGLLIICAWKQTAYWKDGETLWTHALGCTTDNYVANANLGDVFLKEGKVDEAISYFQKAVQINPGYTDGHLHLGNALLQKGRVDEAITQIEQALQIKPDYEKAHNSLGMALSKKGRVDEAIAHYEQALRIKPDYPNAQNNLGNALLRKGRVDEAITHYERALQIKPDFANAHASLADALLQKGRADEAITHFQQALQIKPDLADAHDHLGIALAQKGRVDEAITHFQQALQIKPELADAHDHLGIALLQKGNVNEAITHFRNALQFDPGHEDARINLGKALFQKGKVEESIAQYQIALQTNPGDAQGHFDLGVAFLQEGKVDDAILHFQDALQIRPNYALAQNYLGNAFLRKGRAAEAISHFQKALQIEPANSAIANNLAWLLATWPEASVRNGKQAVQIGERANQLASGGNPFILCTLAAAYAEAGRFSEAVETAQRALHLAEGQSNTSLAGQLQIQIKLYQAGSPFHLPEQKN